MPIRTPRDLGATLRSHRRRRGLDQQELASKIGVSRQWLVEVEKGKPRAEVGLILRALQALDLRLELVETAVPTADAGPAPDIDQIVDSARGTRR